MDVVGEGHATVDGVVVHADACPWNHMLLLLLLLLLLFILLLHL